MKRLYHFLGLIALVVLISGCSGAEKNAPKVLKGELDLRDWDFDRNGNVSLDGSWIFYWDKLYTPADMKKGLPLPSGYIDVPGTWNQQPIGNQYFPGKGV